MKRIILFVLTNLAVVLVLGVVASLLGVNRFLTSNGLDLTALLGFALIMGFGGAFISLLISKPVAKWSSGVQVIAQPSNADEKWLVDTVKKLADKSGIGMPEVGIFEGDPNAFATGAFKNSALVAVSTGLLQNMNHDEIEAVLAHEVAHIANGDMVTMALIQGVRNTTKVFITPWMRAMVTMSPLAMCATSCAKTTKKTQALAWVTGLPPSFSTLFWALPQPLWWPGSAVSVNSAQTLAQPS